MSFIYGIINFNGEKVKTDDLTMLAKSVGFQNFLPITKKYEDVGLGYCHHPERRPKAGIYCNDDLLVLADIRLYNINELRQHFDFSSPEEAFAKAFEKWGCLCANHINGDFAAVVIKKTKKEVLLFRDHIGTRPLVYWKSDNKLIFASHEFGLVKSGLISTSFSEQKLIDSYFIFRKFYEKTFFQEINKVIPGNYIKCTAGSSESKTFWQPGKIQKNNELTFEKAVAHLRKLIVAATVNRIEPGNIGLHVSGGIDSCGIDSIVADHTDNKKLLTGYSWTPKLFEDPVEGINEKEFIEAFSKDKKIDIKYLSLQKYETVKNSLIPEFRTQHIEHPVMQQGEKDNIETLFSGWGGDEFVSLSLRGTVNHLFFSFKWGTLLKYTKEKGIKTTVRKFRIDVFPLFVPFGLLPVYKAGKTNWSKLSLLHFSFVRKHWRQIFLRYNKNIFGYGNRTRFVLNLLGLYHLPERMESWAINAEKYGFEYKYPLLDKQVLEFWFSLPTEFTYKDFKSRLLYREAMKGILTEKIRIRKDKGEALRIAYTLRNNQDGEEYLKNLFYSLKPEEHFPFFRQEALKKVYNQQFSEKKYFDNIKKQQKCAFYLYCVKLKEKYGSIIS